MRNLSSPATPILKLDTSTGLLLPLFDPDSGLLFVTGKGDSVIRTFEVSSANGLTQTPTSFVSSTQIQGACLSSKWALNVMDCEINRIMVVGRSSNSSTDDSLVPISVGVMRKNKMDFQEDLFPDTFVGEDGVVGVSVDAWLKASLNPKVRADVCGFSIYNFLEFCRSRIRLLRRLSRQRGSSTAAAPAPVPAPVPIVASSQRPSAVASVPAAAPAFPSAVQSTPISKPSSTTTAPAASTSTKNSTTTTAPISNVSSSSTPTSPKPPLKLPQQSSFKYIAGTQIKHFEDLRQAAPTLPNECRLLDTNSLYAAFPVSGAGGRIAAGLPVKLPCRNVLYTLHEDGNLRVWELTESLFVVPAAAAAAGKGGLLEDLSVPVKVVKVNGGRSGFLVVHSAIRGLVAVASAEPGHYALKVVAHPEVVFSAAFSFCGTKIVSVCKDGKSGMVVGEAGAHERGSKGARRVYNSNDLSQTAFVTAEMSPSLITPYVDESLPIVFLVGKGESYIQVFHIELNESGSGAAADGIVIKAVTKVATYTASAPQMGASLYVARCYRLTSNAIEQVSFKLPRLKKEYFQDDLFPPLTANKEIYIQQWRDI
ncbi:hypothetical protein BDR26DRAFT_871791 [Obelidium mucronatum]|nr:hypothetical protein BDR26DRAFT_871791 [Obelidium mucronatum]